MKDKTERPVFIGGIQRSGTSLVRAIIGSHPDIAMYQWDLGLWTKYYQIYKHKKLDRGKAKAIIRAIFEDEKVVQSGIALKPEDFFRYNENGRYLRSVGEIIHQFLMYYRDLRGRKRPGLKTPFNEFYADDIFREFPDAGFIHVMRNPLDTATSLKKVKETKWGGRTRYYKHIYQWKRSAKIAMRNTQKYAGNYFVLKYEDIVNHPLESIKACCDFLHIDYDESMLRMDGHIGWKGDNSSFTEERSGPLIFANSIGRYKKALPSRIINRYSVLLEGLLRKFGYADQENKKRHAFYIRFCYRFSKLWIVLSGKILIAVQRSCLYLPLKRLQRIMSSFFVL